METDPIFSPFTLKNFRLKNRLGVAPMTRMSSVKNSIPRQEVLDFLVRRGRPLQPHRSAEADIAYTTTPLP